MGRARACRRARSRGRCRALAGGARPEAAAGAAKVTHEVEDAAPVARAPEARRLVVTGSRRRTGSRASRRARLERGSRKARTPGLRLTALSQAPRLCRRRAGAKRRTSRRCRFERSPPALRQGRTRRATQPSAGGKGPDQSSRGSLERRQLSPTAASYPCGRRLRGAGRRRRRRTNAERQLSRDRAEQRGRSCGRARRRATDGPRARNRGGCEAPRRAARRSAAGSHTAVVLPRCTTHLARPRPAYSTWSTPTTLRRVALRSTQEEASPLRPRAAEAGRPVPRRRSARGASQRARERPGLPREAASTACDGPIRPGWRTRARRRP